MLTLCLSQMSQNRPKSGFSSSVRSRDYRPFCGAGIWILSHDCQLYSRTNSLCGIHSQFGHFAPQVQNEFPPSDPDIRTGGLCGVNNRNTNFRTNLREKPANSRWSVGFTALISCIYVLQTIPTQPVQSRCEGRNAGAPPYC